MPFSFWDSEPAFAARTFIIPMRLSVSPHIFPKFEAPLYFARIFQVSFPLFEPFFNIAGKNTEHRPDQQDQRNRIKQRDKHRNKQANQRCDRQELGKLVISVSSVHPCLHFFSEPLQPSFHFSLLLYRFALFHGILQQESKLKRNYG